MGILAVLGIFNYRRAPIKKRLQRHFGATALDDLVITGREFHARVRADLQRAIDQFFVSGTTMHLTCGIRQEHPFFGVSFSELLANYGSTLPVAMEYEDVDIGGKQRR
ncbi:MAG: hypothetical protein GXY83_29055 [Rhodopirellula sp.]|nr:hypothetical protein [Rhodopirellula sp.]